MISVTKLVFHDLLQTISISFSRMLLFSCILVYLKTLHFHGKDSFSMIHLFTLLRFILFSIFRVHWVQETPNGMYQYFLKVSVLMQYSSSFSSFLVCVEAILYVGQSSSWNGCFSNSPTPYGIWTFMLLILPYSLHYCNYVYFLPQNDYVRSSCNSHTKIYVNQVLG